MEHLLGDFFNNPSSTLRVLFIIACAAYFTVKWWLSERQMRYITHHMDAVPAPFDSQITLNEHQFSARYALARLRFGRFGLVVSTVALLFWTLGGGLNILAHWVLAHVTDHPLHFGVAFMVLFSLIGSMIELPLSYVSQFKIEAGFGFNHMTIRLWLVDMLKNAVLSAAIALPLLYGILQFMALMPQTWWLWAWSLFIALNVLMMWLYPTVIAPLFNTFTPLDEGDLKQRLDALLNRCGFKSNGMFVMDGSRRSAHGNAYFTGFGANKRIVFFDTLLKQLTEPQIEAVLAHELGHFHHKHILRRMLIILPLSLLIFAALGYLANQTWFYDALGVSPSALQAQPTHLFAVGMVLFSLALPVFTFILSPIASNGSRKDEFQADEFAVNNSNGQELINALVSMYQENASFVGTDPLYSRFYDSHPPALIRVARLQKLLEGKA
ncbi:M48 family metallopeptidase [Hydromonas duriensis]|uniref:STE24 endopeptidase n=1 Tax=Hydromonas duriensis TaxID=1527608 RepID=A0A4R6YAA8_9BURK|nr:M48 family metallopeptidase [Hydromonas duriensis]TDR32404.1 STE24 endopeptidase [Hydromonas duriensis]